MSKQHNLLVPVHLILKIHDYIHLCETPAGKETQRAEILAFIEKKAEAHKLRRLYEEYKSALPGSAAREEARNRYLDEKGIAEDFRTSCEVTDCELR